LLAAKWPWLVGDAIDRAITQRDRAHSLLS